MKKLLFIVATIFTLATNAQVTKVSLQASGLTCSMCSNSINKSLKTIPAVTKVTPNIKTSTFEIFFKQDSNVDFELLKKKVEEAGFSVSNFIATVEFNNTPVKGNTPVTVGDKTFRFLNTGSTVLNGQKNVRIVDKGFISTKEFKKSPVTPVAAGVKVYNATI